MSAFEIAAWLLAIGLLSGLIWVDWGTSKSTVSHQAKEIERLERLERLEKTVRCGRVDNDLDVEARFEAIRKAEGRTTGLAECCGLLVPLRFAYRCLECGRWAHAECLARHFISAGNTQPMIIGGVGHAVNGDWGREMAKYVRHTDSDVDASDAGISKLSVDNADQYA